MRILYVCNEYPPAIHGGIGVFVRTLAERLAEAGHETAVIGFASHASARSQAIEAGVQVVRLPWPRSRGDLRLGRFRLDPLALSVRKLLSREAARLAADFRAHLVESHDWSGPLWTAPARPWVVRLHGAAGVNACEQGNRAARLLRYFERRNLRMADAVVAGSQFIAERTRRILRLGREPRIVYHGVDIDRFQPRNGPRDPSEVLFVGTVKKSKGIRDFFEAIPRIAASCPEARFTIAGRHSENPSDPCAPQRLLETLPAGLRGSVRFLGYVTQVDLAQLYSRAAAAVFPSHVEAFGLACAEAMSCGTAVVMTVRGSGPELIEPGRSGLLVEPSDTAALAFGVTRLLRHAALRRTLGANARLRVLEKFDLNDAVANNLLFYESISRVHKHEGVYV